MRFGQSYCLLFVLGCLLAACGQTEPARLYTLSDLANRDVAERSPDPISLGLEPVVLPAYLDRPQIVVRQSRNQLTVAEFDRWAEPIFDMVPNILARNLRYLLESDRVYLLPQRRTRELDYVLNVEFEHFEMIGDGKAFLAARWEIFEPESGKLLNDGRTVVELGGHLGQGYEDFVALLSDALGEFALQLVDEITSLTVQASG